MILGRVVGQVWATRRDPRLSRAKLLVIRPHGIYEPALGTRHLVAVDDVDAGIGDEVVVCLGMPARQSLGSNDTPVDAAVLGVVDRIELDDARLPEAGAAPGIRRALSAAAGMLRRVGGAGLRPAESSREVQGTPPGFLSDRKVGA